MTTDQVIVSVSGARGVIGRGLSPEVAARFAAALGTYARGGRVILGRDSRPSGEMLRHAALAGLAGAGCEAVDIGIAPTPTVGVAVRELGAAGGLQITASHNPAPWNGLKLFGADGAVLPTAEGEAVRALYESGELRRAGTVTACSASWTCRASGRGGRRCCSTATAAPAGRSA